VNTAGPGSRWLDDHQEDVPWPIENIAARGQPQDLGYIDAHYDGVDHFLLQPPIVSNTYP
jgi:hypothetical protein